MTWWWCVCNVYSLFIFAVSHSSLEKISPPTRILCWMITFTPMHDVTQGFYKPGGGKKWIALQIRSIYNCVTLFTCIYADTHTKKLLHNLLAPCFLRSSSWWKDTKLSKKKTFSCSSLFHVLFLAPFHAPSLIKLLAGQLENNFWQPINFLLEGTAAPAGPKRKKIRIVCFNTTYWSVRAAWVFQVARNSLLIWNFTSESRPDHEQLTIKQFTSQFWLVGCDKIGTHHFSSRLFQTCLQQLLARRFGCLSSWKQPCRSFQFDFYSSK